MLIDLTLKIKKEMVKIASENEMKVLFGHIGTHFDVMNKTFPLNYTRRKGIVFDISDIQDREIDISDIQLDDVKRDMCVLFFSGFIEKEGYGKPGYFVSIKDSHIENECFWNYPMVIKGAFFHEAVSHLFNRVKTQNR